jgi:peptide/nickel transport system permease protein
VAGLVVLAAIALVAMAAPLLPLPDPDATDLAARLAPPLSAGHPLGTDHLGRDILARVVWGARVSLAVGLVAALVSGAVGSLVGLVAGFFSRWVDTVLMRAVDTLMAFPYLLLALAIIAVLGPGLLNALIAVAIVNVPFFARAVRGVTLGLARREFVEAARLSGLSSGQILYRELLPNVMPTVVITVATTVGWMILETAGLSFLGLGAQPPQADLGSMLGEGRKVFIPAPHVTTIPGLVILGLVMAINLVSDGIRDMLDPRLRSGALARPSAVTAVAPAVQALGSEPDLGTLLKVENLCVRFRLGSSVHRAVDGATFELHPGECLGLVGESGCGKSVTALSIMRLVSSPPGRIEEGRVLYRGGNLSTAAFETLRNLRGNRVTYVFQDPSSALDPLFTVGDQIAETIRAHRDVATREAREQAIGLLRQVQIAQPEQRSRAYPHELSGGMRQRVGIAMALANDPDLIIADEPTTALDVTTQAEVLRLLRELCREREVALVFITHDFGVVSEICDRVVVMYAGQIVETGTVDAVLYRPHHPYTRRLMDCVPRLGEPERDLDAIPGLPPRVDDLPAGCYFAERCDRVVDACRTRPVPLDEIEPGREARCIRAREINGTRLD